MFVGGLAAGVLGSFVHAYTVAGLPVGLLTGLGLCLAVFVTSGLALRGRRGVAVSTAGWLVAVVMLSLRRPEGDLVVPGTLLGYAWLLGGLVVAAVAAAWHYAPAGRNGADPALRRTAPAPRRNGVDPAPRGNGVDPAPRRSRAGRPSGGPIAGRSTGRGGSGRHRSR